LPATGKPEDPDLLAEQLLACAGLDIDCADAARRADAAIESGEGKKYAALAGAAGRYQLGKRASAKALSNLEAWRDKGGKNKIEANDAALLTDLAEAHYRTKQYSEALEIFFEMNKRFPEVRRIQDALQGVYAVEHKGAGDVKIN
jgi:hypothetical protein